MCGIDLFVLGNWSRGIGKDSTALDVSRRHHAAGVLWYPEIVVTELPSVVLLVGGRTVESGKETACTEWSAKDTVLVTR
jgi:hypothetical protein